LAQSRVLVKGEALRKKRLELLLQQQELAAKAHVSSAVLSQLETGRRRSTSPRIVRRLAKALKCHPFDIAEIVELEAEAS
jgi:predicted transcriptional regulator